jgi:NTP pyrophosphatase (non-canonical NTP hydrolase)
MEVEQYQTGPVYTTIYNGQEVNSHLHLKVDDLDEASEVIRSVQAIQAIASSHNDHWWHDAKTGEDLRVNPHPLLFSNKLMLIVSELAEAMEGDRTSAMDKKLPTRPEREVELADALIRIVDLAQGFKLDLAGAVAEKLNYNKSRLDHKIEARLADNGKKY